MKRLAPIDVAVTEKCLTAVLAAPALLGFRVNAAFTKALGVGDVSTSAIDMSSVNNLVKKLVPYVSGQAHLPDELVFEDALLGALNAIGRKTVGREKGLEDKIIAKAVVDHGMQIAENTLDKAAATDAIFWCRRRVDNVIAAAGGKSLNAFLKGEKGIDRVARAAFKKDELTQMLHLSVSVFEDPEKLKKMFGQLARVSFPDASPAELDAVLTDIMKGLGPELKKALDSAIESTVNPIYAN